MKKTPIVVLASGNGSTLQAIADNCEHAEVVAVICDQPGAYVLKRAEKLGIQARVVAKIPAESREDYDRKLAEVVASFNPELVVLAGFMRILTRVFIERFERTTNIHPSFLPKFKGLDTYQRALDEGETVHGTTVHEVIVELDSGPILAQRSVPVLEGDTADTLRERTQVEERKLYPLIIDKLVTGQMGFQTRYGKNH